MQQKYIDCVHLLLGLLREAQSGAAATLRQYGVVAAELRQRVSGPLYRGN